MKPPKIVVLDDETPARQGLTKLLRQHDYDVTPTLSGKQAVAEVARNGVAAVILDIKMKQVKYDGIDAAQDINRLRPDIPIIFYTAYADEPEYRKRVEDANLSPYWIDKPIDDNSQKQLLRTLEESTHNYIKMELRRVVDTSVQQGIMPIQALTVLLNYEREIPLQVVEELEQIYRILPNQTRWQLLREMKQALLETSQHFEDLLLRQLAFASFKKRAMERLWDAYENASKPQRELALQIRMTVRRMLSLELTAQHLEALNFAIDKLAQEDATDQDVIEAKRKLRRSGIETLISLGSKTDEFLESYEAEEQEGSSDE